MQYQKSLRFAEARKWLKQGRQQIADIAYQVGYESPSQFSCEYHRYFINASSMDFPQQEALHINVNQSAVFFY